MWSDSGSTRITLTHSSVLSRAKSFVSLAGWDLTDLVH